MTLLPRAIVSSSEPVLLVGGGPICADDLSILMALSSQTVAADGGATALLEAGTLPDAVIGDMDSLPKALAAVVPNDRLLTVSEQDTTDFEKCLSRIDAPLVLATGVATGRMDHLLAAFNVLARWPDKRCIIMGSEDIAFLAPPLIDLDLPAGTTVSFFPLGHVTSKSIGLRWPLDGLVLEPAGQIGASNQATGPVQISVDAARMLIMLPRAHLNAAMGALQSAPHWAH